MRRKTSVVCIGVGSCLLPDASVEARARLQRCGRLTSPMIRLLRGVCQHPSPLMSRGGRSQAIPAGSFDAEARAAWQVGMAACNRRTVLQIRRYDSRRSSPSVFGQRQYSRPPRGLLPNLMDGTEAGPQRGWRLASPWLFCRTYVRPSPNRPCRRFSIPLRLETARPGRGQSGHR